MSASSVRDRADLLPIEALGEECNRCGDVLEYVGIGKSDRRIERRTVHEYLECRGCGAGGALVKLAENDRIKRRLGPATRPLRGRTAEARERSLESGSESSLAPASLEGWSE